MAGSFSVVVGCSCDCRVDACTGALSFFSFEVHDIAA